MCGAHRRFQIVTHENPTFSLTTKVQSSVEEEGDFLVELHQHIQGTALVT